jgi:putative membrane protein
MPSEERLHPLSLVFVLAAQARAFIVPAVLVVFATQKSGAWELMTAVFLIPYAGFALLRYLTFRYRLDSEELVVRWGLWWRSERHIRCARIHNVEIVQNPLHRLFGVAEVRVETGGQDEPEARLQVLSLAAAEDVRRRVFEVRGLATAGVAGDASAGNALGAPAPRVVLRLPITELVLLGLAENRGMLVVGAAMGFLFSGNFYDVLGMDQWSFSRILDVLMERSIGVTGESGRAVTLLVALALFILFVPVRLLSICWTLLQLYGFTLTRDGRGLRSRAGLLTRVEAAVPEHRIQRLTILEPPLLRVFGRVAVRVETAGGEQGAAVTRQWLAPILPRAALPALLREVFADLDLAALAWNPVHPRAGRRLFGRWIWTSLVVTAIALALAWPSGWIVLPLMLAWSLLVANRQARALAWSMAPGFIASRGGWLWRHVSVARHARVQAVEWGATPFDRRWGMASVAADTAGGGTHQIRIWPLDQQVARELHAALAARAAATAFRW